MQKFYNYTLLLCLAMLLLYAPGRAKELPTWHGIRTPVPLTTAGNGYTNWQWLSPLPHGNNNKGVWLIDSTTWIIAGGAGTVMKTTNAGTSWNVQFHTAGQSDLKQVAFIDDLTGFILGKDIIWTRDGGSNWLVLETLHNGGLNDIAFASHDTGFVVGTKGTILRSVDAGRNWSQTLLAGNLNILGVNAPDPLNAFAVAINEDDSTAWFIKTTDGGENWNESKCTEDRPVFPRGISFPDVLHGWIVGFAMPNESGVSNGFILKTTDGGGSWSKQLFVPESNSDAYQFSNVDFADADHGVVVGYGHKMSTTDGGSTWNTFNQDMFFANYAKFLNNRIVIMTGDNGRVFSSIDGGSTWRNVTKTYADDFATIAFPDSAHGYALGENGTFLRTTDGGNTWKDTILLDSKGSPYWTGTSMGFKDGNHGIVVYDRDAYLTSDGGITWEKVPEISPNKIACVAVQGDDAWAVGDGGTIVFSSDGGHSWSSQTSPTEQALHSVHFSDAVHGAAVGWRGTSVHTTDGGVHWVLEDQGFAYYQSVFFPDANNGFIANDGGDGYSGWRLQKTTDGGEHWLDLSDRMPAYYWPHGVYFTDQNFGVTAATNWEYWAGDNSIMRTTDGGESWIPWENPSEQLLYAVQYVHSGSGYVAYAAGGGGTILVAAISPQNSRTWTWTGLIDSSWNNPDNWSPASVPQPGDSVVIGPSSNNPIMDSVRTQITIASLHILSGGKLTVTDSVSRLAVLGDVIVEGTLEVLPSTTTQFLIGGNWNGSGSGSSSPRAERKTQNHASTGNEGFIPSHSRVEFSGQGNISGTFYNLTLDTLVNISSNGNIFLLNQATLLSDLTMQPNDTIYVQAGLDQPFIGPGKVVGGTIAQFTSYSITATADEYGHISPGGTISVISGNDARVAFIPDAGCHVDSVFVDGIKVDSSAGYTFKNVADSHFIRVVFAINQNTIVTMAGSHGAIIPPGPVVFTPGSNQRFVFTPDAGYHVAAVFIDDIIVDSTAGYTFTNLNVSHGIRVIFASTMTLVVPVSDRWNLVSVPLIVSDYAKNTLFHNAISDAYMYNNGYQPQSILTNGIGYWLKFHDAQAVSILGFPCLNDTFSLKTGWNMIGSISHPVAIASITGESPGLTLSKFFGYSNGYHQIDTIYPGKGYWVKASQDGSIILSASSLVASENRITIIPTLELPPPPPDEMQNVSNRIPDDFALRQNYPNPFNPATVLRYDLPINADVRLTIINILGQTTATLVDGLQSAGYKSVTWNAVNVPSGLYFYRLDATGVGDTRNSYSRTNKMILVR